MKDERLVQIGYMTAKVDISGDGGADKWLLRREDFDGWFVPDNPYDIFRLAAEIANKKYYEEKAEKNRERRALRGRKTSERILERLRTVYWEAAEQRGAEERRAKEQRERRAERDRERRKRQRRAERDRERRKRQRREREAAVRQGDGEKVLFSAAKPPLLVEQPLQRVAADGLTYNIGDVLRPPARVKGYIEGVGGSDVGRALREQEATERMERLRREYQKAEEGGALPRGGDRERERERDHQCTPLSSEAGAPLPLSAPPPPPALRAVAAENGDAVLLPGEVKAYIDRVGGSEAKLVIDKCLFETDVKRSQNRLSIPLKKVRTEFLTADEKEYLGDGVKNMGKPIPAIQVMLLQPNMSTATIILKRWDMRKAASGKTNPMYVLGTHWNDVVKANNLIAGQPIALWSFRRGMRLCFALVRVR